MNRTKIDWADHTWNPVTGCRNECPYCYAKSITKRFSGDVRLNKSKTDSYTFIQRKDLYILEEPFLTREGRTLNYPFGFEPTLHRYRMDMPQKLKQSKNIFVGSMADLFADYIPYEWIEEVFKATEEAPQHNYLFLTNNPNRYKKLHEKGLLPSDDNYWYGTTTIAEGDPFFNSIKYNTFSSIEPIISEMTTIGDQNRHSVCDWIIVGAETGNRKGKVIPKKEWILIIKEQCRAAGVPLFMKESLRNLMGDDFIQELPEGLKKLKKVPKNTALYKRLNSECGICKVEGLKSDMVALLVREKRGASAKHLTHLCIECLKTWCKTLDINMPD